MTHDANTVQKGKVAEVNRSDHAIAIARIWNSGEQHQVNPIPESVILSAVVRLAVFR